MICRIAVNYNLSNPKPGHSTGASGLGGARRDRGAGPGRTGRRQIGPPRGQPSPAPHQSMVRTCSKLFFRGTKKTKCHANRWGGGQPALGPIGSAVYQRDEERSSCFCLLTSGPGPFWLCKPFSCKACPGICRTINLNTPRTSGAAQSLAGWDWARQGGTEQRLGGADRPGHDPLFLGRQNVLNLSPGGRAH